MPSKSAKNASYDLKSADRKRDWIVKGGLTALVIVFAVGLVFYIVTNGKVKPKSDEVRSIHIAAANVVTKPGTSDPKVQISLYEDFLCPMCGQFEQFYGPTVNKLIDSGAVSVDYYMTALLWRQNPNSYSSRSAAMAYCVADENKDAFRRFHAALYAQQPSETASTFPDNAKLLEVARQSGVGVGPNDPVGKCVNNGTYLDMVNALVANTKIQGTPTIKINGQEVGNDLMGGATKPDPQLLVDKIKAIAGDVPGLGTAPPAMRPGGAPGAPQPPAVPAPPAAPAPEAPAQP